MDQEFLHGSTFAEQFDFRAKYYELWIHGPGVPPPQYLGLVFCDQCIFHSIYSCGPATLIEFSVAHARGLTTRADGSMG